MTWDPWDFEDLFALLTVGPNKAQDQRRRRSYVHEDGSPFHLEWGVYTTSRGLGTGWATRATTLQAKSSFLV
jgi:hypothetical protein